MSPKRTAVKTPMEEKIKASEIPVGVIAKAIGVNVRTLLMYRSGRLPAPDEVVEKLAAYLTKRGTPCTAEELRDPDAEYRGPGRPPKPAEPAPLHAVGAPPEPFDLVPGALFKVPVYGYIAAGPATEEPFVEVDTMLVEEDVARRMVDGKRRIVRTRGRSMEQRGVFDGDDLDVEQRPATDGEVVIADLDGRVFLATAKMRGAKVLRLEKAAPGLKDIVPKRGQTLTIRWVVLEIIKRQRPDVLPRGDAS